MTPCTFYRLHNFSGYHLLKFPRPPMITLGGLCLCNVPLIAKLPSDNIFPPLPLFSDNETVTKISVSHDAIAS